MRIWFGWLLETEQLKRAGACVFLYPLASRYHTLVSFTLSHALTPMCRNFIAFSTLYIQGPDNTYCFTENGYTVRLGDVWVQVLCFWALLCVLWQHAEIQAHLAPRPDSESVPLGPGGPNSHLATGLQSRMCPAGNPPHTWFKPLPTTWLSISFTKYLANFHCYCWNTEW